MTSQPTDIDQPSELGESKTPDGDQYSEEETARRRDQVVRRMLNSPPKPHKPRSPGRNGKPSPGKPLRDK
jgi:hypothetical protein